MSVERILHYFRAISAIPRRSGDEEAIAAYLLKTGKQLGLETFRDSGGNVILRKPGHGRTRPIILQSHMDMVWESEGAAYEEGVCVRERDGILYAEHSTLGADNGIGMALTLSLLEQEDVTNVEALFTVEEETSMSGASNLDGSLLSGQQLINLDSEQDGVFTTSSAGGQSMKLSFPLSRESVSAPHASAWRLTVSGAKGGHSGLEINRPHGNAIQILAQWLTLLPGQWSLLSLEGGIRANAIPVQAEAVIYAESRESLLKAARIVTQRWRCTESELCLSVGEETVPVSSQVVSTTCQAGLPALLAALPHGVLKSSLEMIQLSCNLARIWTETDCLCAEISIRAASAALLEQETEAIMQIAREYQGESLIYGAYPPWEKTEHSDLERELLHTYRALFGKNAICEHVHAGVECGVLQQRAPFIRDMVSIGPTITGAHTVHETVERASIEKLERLLLSLLMRRGG